jgi:hypothetical protein
MKFENKKWVLRVALAGALSLGVASVAKADARLDGMGADVRQVDDVDGIWLYPNQILQYKNTVDFRLAPTGEGSTPETGTAVGTNEWGGVIHDLGDDFGTIATYVNRPSAISNVAGSLLIAPISAIKPIFGTVANTVGSFTNIYAPSSNADVFWGHTNFLGLGDAAIHLNYGDNEAISSAYSLGGVATPQNVSSQVWGLSFGLNLGSFLGFASQGHIDYSEDFLTLNRVASKGNNTPLTDNGVYTIKLGWLGQNTLNDKDNLRVFADLQYDNDSLPTGWTSNATGVGVPTGGQSANDLEVLLGSSIKHNITDKGFVNTGLELEYDGGQSVASNSYSSWTFLWNANVESALNSFLTMRAGLEKIIVNRTYTSTPPGSTYFDNSTTLQTLGAVNGNNNVAFTLGGSINVENWTLDTQVAVSAFDGAIANVAPGSGVFFSPVAGTTSILTTTEADLRYKF